MVSLKASLRFYLVHLRFVDLAFSDSGSGLFGRQFEAPGLLCTSSLGSDGSGKRVRLGSERVGGLGGSSSGGGTSLGQVGPSSLPRKTGFEKVDCELCFGLQQLFEGLDVRAVGGLFGVVQILSGGQAFGEVEIGSFQLALDVGAGETVHAQPVQTLQTFTEGLFVVEPLVALCRVEVHHFADGGGDGALVN